MSETNPLPHCQRQVGHGGAGMVGPDSGRLVGGWGWGALCCGCEGGGVGEQGEEPGGVTFAGGGGAVGLWR